MSDSEHKTFELYKGVAGDSPTVTGDTNCCCPCCRPTRCPLCNRPYGNPWTYPYYPTYPYPYYPSYPVWVSNTGGSGGHQQ